ncbi:peptidoglycan editing factor PgeF [Sediminicurvatus halobius]|uniref:Purine nucleoside phosphorylase n=1 Tax=Sediminicurvatus halobius TaxID=2182432 RepID=A0A2U2N0V7_9GAMM|nr:peptidoglycan editing factor PgeF [Spiribacter halobius]PWG62619.1 peptidoglycan editing factor PgeF [Spiribacter halobius]UEX78462.1 peptidoglycan editing factor PgeF [Spiribacter halobius]
MSVRHLLLPDWPRPPGVCALATTRAGGVSKPPFDTLNLGTRAGDDPSAVAANRGRLRHLAALPAVPSWLAQVHGRRVVHADEVMPDVTEADAVWSDRPGAVCAVLVADCLPVLLADRDGRCVAAAHAGWRGLAGGVLEATVAALPVGPGALVAWLGPCIGPDAFEVGVEVREAFLDGDSGATGCFRPSPAGRWLADLGGLARRRLAGAGVAAIHGGGLCTYSDPARFFSYRRDGRTGRMAALVWMQ